MVYIFLADGFEEIEALAPADVLRRAEIDVKLCGVGGDVIRGSHGISVVCDSVIEEAVLNERTEAVILPGGMPGTLNLEKSELVQLAVDFAVENERLVCAICAAPSILGHKGLLKGKNAISFPGFETELKGAVISEKYVVKDGKFITAKGMGSAVEFGLEIVKALKGSEAAEKIRASLQIYRG